MFPEDLKIHIFRSPTSMKDTELYLLSTAKSELLSRGLQVCVNFNASALHLLTPRRESGNYKGESTGGCRPRELRALEGGRLFV